MTSYEGKEEPEENDMAETKTCAVQNSAESSPKAVSSEIAPLQLSLAVDVVILNTPLTAMIEKHDDGSMELLIMPQYQTQADQFTLADFINGINDAFKSIIGSDKYKLDANDVENKLSGFLENVKGISVALQEVFLHVSFGSSDKSDVTLEYAFSVKITSKAPETKGFTFAEIQSVSFGLWNTTKESILSQMGLTSISELLENGW